MEEGNRIKSFPFLFYFFSRPQERLSVDKRSERVKGANAHPKTLLAVLYFFSTNPENLLALKRGVNTRALFLCWVYADPSCAGYYPL